MVDLLLGLPSASGLAVLLLTSGLPVGPIDAQLLQPHGCHLNRSIVHQPQQREEQKQENEFCRGVRIMLLLAADGKLSSTYGF